MRIDHVIVWAASIAALWTAPAWAEEAAAAPECLAMARRIETDLGVRIIEMTPMILFESGLPAAADRPNEMTVECAEDRSDDTVNLHWEQSAEPPEAYYQLVGRVGAILTGDAPSAISAGVRKCHGRARQSATEMGTVLIEKTRIECHAFARDGGAAGARLYRRGPDDREGD